MDVQGYLETLRLLPLPSADDCSKRPQSDAHGVSVAIVLIALGFMYSVHNLIAPNMTAIAKNFHFNNYERDAYIGGELTLFFYIPGVLGALLAGILSSMLDRRLLLATLAFLTSIACLMTTRVSTFSELAWARAATGFAIGGSLPVVYSLVGDWFPASKRASATAFVTAASGAGVFAGQCIATLMGSSDWRLPFFVIALPAAVTGGMIWCLAKEPVRGGQEDGVESSPLYKSTGVHHMPTFSGRHLRALMHNRTNLLVILQAFPGNIPWGVIVVYLHDFLVEDLGLSRRTALGAIATLAGSGLVGILTGGFVGESVFGASSRQFALFGGVCNMARAVPFILLFGWSRFFGPVGQSSEVAFFLVLILGGFIATMASPCTGAMLLNVNLPETRGSVMALYAVLDDLSKGFGTLFVSMIVGLVGGRALAYQISLLLWVFTGAALLWTYHTYEDDVQQMKKLLEEARLESMVLVSKQRAQHAIRDRAKAAGEAHFAQKNLGIRRDQLNNMSWGSGKRPLREPLSAAWTLEHGQPSFTGAADSPVQLGGLLTASAPGQSRPLLAASRFQADRGRLHSAARAAAEAATAAAARGSCTS